MDDNMTDYNFPCTLCMGFCSPDDKSLLCHFCTNWFHQSCTKTSNKQFDKFSNTSEIHSLFKCSICLKTTHCDICHSLDTTTSNSLYCVTCLNVICDTCNPISSDQIHEFRSSTCPFYCSTCVRHYPCIVCNEHCYNDALHQPSIHCDICNKWVHFKCSKLTISQFNKYGRTDLPYFCSSCINQTLPYNQLSNAALKKCEIEKADSDTSISRKSYNFTNTGSCSLCLECNPDCDSCDICPNIHRVCNDCIDCKYLKTSEMNTLITNTLSHDISFMHFNIRSLTKNLHSIEDLIYESLNKYPDIICITETKLNEKSDL